MSELRTLALFAVLGAIASTGRTIVPDEQLIPKAILDEVVRIYADGAAGTGSIIDKHNVYNGQGQVVGYDLCILTANHVVKNRSQLSIAFNNIGNPNQGPHGAWLVAEGRDKQFGSPSNPEFPDLAILGCRVAKTEFTESLDPLTVIDDTQIPAGSSFSVVGYGNTGYLDDINGDHIPDGYQEVNGTYGTRRWANNIFDYKVKHHWGQWNHQAWEYDLTGPIPGVIGEGFPLRGDSGGPLLVSDPTNITVYGPAPQLRPTYTNSIVGVVSFGETGFIDWGDKEYDVRITPEYREWIEMECHMVPEPATMAALGLGLAAVLRTRRKKA